MEITKEIAECLLAIRNGSGMVSYHRRQQLTALGLFADDRLTETGDEALRTFLQQHKPHRQDSADTPPGRLP